MLNAQTSLNFMGEDFLATFEIEVSNYGTPESGRYGPPENYDPGSDPEYQVVSIVLQHDTPQGLGPSFEATGQLFFSLCSAFDDWLVEQVVESKDSDWPDSQDWDEDYYRGER